MTPTATLPEAVAATVAGSEVGKKNLITGDGFFEQGADRGRRLVAA